MPGIGGRGNVRRDGGKDRHPRRGRMQQAAARRIGVSGRSPEQGGAWDAGGVPPVGPRPLPCTETSAGPVPRSFRPSAAGVPHGTEPARFGSALCRHRSVTNTQPFPRGTPSAHATAVWMALPYPCCSGPVPLPVPPTIGGTESHATTYAPEQSAGSVR